MDFAARPAHHVIGSSRWQRHRVKARPDAQAVAQGDGDAAGSEFEILKSRTRSSAEHHHYRLPRGPVAAARYPPEPLRRDLVAAASHRTNLGRKPPRDASL